MTIIERLKESLNKNMGAWIIGAMLAFSVAAHYRDSSWLKAVCDEALVLNELALHGEIGDHVRRMADVCDQDISISGESSDN